LKKTITSHVTSILDVDSVEITKPKDLSFGHYCTPISFSLAKVYRKNPHAIAAELAEQLAHEELFSEVSAVSGYINFKFSDVFLDRFTTDALKSGVNFAKEQNDAKVLVEYVSANPTGPLHIGHARGAVYGDTLVRVGRHLGYDVTAEYYVNDAGNQIVLLGTSLIYAGRVNVLGESVEEPEEYYRGEYIIDVAKRAAEVFGQEIFTDSDRFDSLCMWAKDQMLEMIQQCRDCFR